VFEPVKRDEHADGGGYTGSSSGRSTASPRGTASRASPTSGRRWTDTRATETPLPSDGIDGRGNDSRTSDPGVKTRTDASIRPIAEARRTVHRPFVRTRRPAAGPP
jgi:hypothetical protein